MMGAISSQRMRRCKVVGTYEGGLVLDGSAHSLSRALASQSASVACCTLYLSLCANRRNTRQLPSFGRLCAYTVTCPREPVSFIRLPYAVCLFLRSTRRSSSMEYSAQEIVIGCVELYNKISKAFSVHLE
jgi:hypothetical protein